MAGAATLAFGNTSWPTYLLSQLCIAACLWAVWRLGRELLGPGVEGYIQEQWRYEGLTGLIIAGTYEEPVKMLGEVVHVQRVPGEEAPTFDVGVRFVAPPEAPTATATAKA